MALRNLFTLSMSSISHVTDGDVHQRVSCCVQSGSHCQRFGKSLSIKAETLGEGLAQLLSQHLLGTQTTHSHTGMLKESRLYPTHSKIICMASSCSALQVTLASEQYLKLCSKYLSKISQYRTILFKNSYCEFFIELWYWRQKEFLNKHQLSQYQ